MANNTSAPLVKLSELTCDSILQSNGSNVPPSQGNADIAGIGVSTSPLRRKKYRDYQRAKDASHDFISQCLPSEEKKKKGRLEYN